MKAIVGVGILVLGGLAIAAAVAARGADRDSGDNRRTDGGTETQGSAGEFEVDVTPEMRRHSRIRNLLYFAGTLYGFGALILILGSGLSRKLRDLTRRFKRPSIATMCYFAMFSAVAAILTFPLDVYGGFIVPHQFDLSNQTFSAWLGDYLKGLGVTLVVGAPIVALALWGIRRMPRRWWLAIWLGGIPIALFMVVLSPILIEPLFNDFKRLENAGLEARLLRLAERAGIEGSKVYEVDRSRQTKTMNAYVTGLGPSKRIVIWDTLLAKMSDDEVVFVMAHEMGHYVLHHIWKGLAFGFGLMFFVLMIGHRVVEWGTVHFGRSWGFDRTDDPAAIPWLMLVLSGFLFMLSPVISGYSRTIEHEADVFGLELTRLNEDSARAFIKFAEDSKVDPSPNAFIELWRYSHPPLSKRIEFALSYRPWTRSEPNRVWKGLFVPAS